MIFKVKVDSWYRNTPAVTTKRVRRIFVLEADNGDAAMTKGKAHAEATAKFGLDWIGFEPREACSMTLPLELKA